MRALAVAGCHHQVDVPRPRRGRLVRRLPLLSPPLCEREGINAGMLRAEEARGDVPRIPPKSPGDARRGGETHQTRQGTAVVPRGRGLAKGCFDSGSAALRNERPRAAPPPHRSREPADATAAWLMGVDGSKPDLKKTAARGGCFQHPPRAAAACGAQPRPTLSTRASDGRAGATRNTCKCRSGRGADRASTWAPSRCPWPSSTTARTAPALVRYDWSHASLRSGCRAV